MHNSNVYAPDVGADLSRSVDPVSSFYRGVGALSDAVGRWSWVRDYERAEAHYWPEGGN